MVKRVLMDEEMYVLARLGKNEDSGTRLNDLKMIVE
jgi:hypothetical protein